jgi:ribosomal protein L37E
MSPICLIKGCHPESTACRCRRCGRSMHGWQQIEKNEIHSELLGHTRDGLMRYARAFQVKHRCASCGVERDEVLSEHVDH